jgi:hypothetical protein
LQAERLELLGPVAWQVGKTREADAAGHAIVGDGLDQARSEIGGMSSRLTRGGGFRQGTTTAASPTIAAASRVSAISIDPS